VARIAGIDIPRDKKVPYSLCYIHGIGLTLANEICDHAKINKDTRVKDMSDSEVASVRDAISTLEIKVEGEQRTYVSMNIKRKRDIGCSRIEASSWITGEWAANQNEFKNSKR